MNREVILRGIIIDILVDYSRYLERHGYIDCDWNSEEPYAIDEYVKEKDRIRIELFNKMYDAIIEFRVYD